MRRDVDYKRAQRERDRAAGDKVITIKLTADEVRKLELARTLRNAGAAPYPVNDYLTLLLENDVTQLVQQMAQLKPCGRCGKTLPETCGGDFKSEAACFLNRDYRHLALTRLTCQTGEFDDLLTRYNATGGAA